MASELFPLRSEQVRPKSLASIARIYLQYWYWIVLGVVLALGGAFVYLRYFAVPQYAVGSTLLIKPTKVETSLSTADLVGASGNPLTTRSIDDEIVVLTSRGLMSRVVKELALNTSYYIKGKFNNVEVYEQDLPVKVLVQQLDSSAYDKTITLQLVNEQIFRVVEPAVITSYKLGQPVTRPYGRFTVVSMPGAERFGQVKGQEIIVRFRSPHDFVNQFSASLTVAPIKKESNALLVGLVDALPARGKAVLNKLLEDYNREALEDKNQMATSTIAFLDDRLKYITPELNSVERNEEQYKRRNEVANVNTQAAAYVSQASENDRKLSEWATQIGVLESIEHYLQEKGGQSRMIVPSTLGFADPTLLALVNRFNDLQLERARMLRTTEVDNPLVQAQTEQIASLQANILENLGNIKRGLVITSNALRASSKAFSSRIRSVPVIERELGEIKRQQTTKQNLYAYLLQKREESALLLAATTSNSRVIDPATVNPIPVSPNKQILYLVAMLLGLAVPMAGIYVKDLLDDRVQDRGELEHATAIPILGEIAHHPGGGLAVMARGNNPAAEAFRFIRAKLNFVNQSRPNQVILVTSGTSGEGKTFFSTNLAASFVQAGERVVVLELDLRQPALLRSLQMQEGLGLADYLSTDQMPVTEIVQFAGLVPGLAVIGAGSAVDNPAELLLTPKLAALLTELRLSFDRIIIDTAPVGLVADALGLSTLVDSSIYLVRRRHTSKKSLSFVDTIYRANLLPHVMLVLNDALGQEVYGYGYGYGRKAIGGTQMKVLKAS